MLLRIGQTLIIVSFLLTSAAHSAYWESLPKGVRLVVLKFLKTNNIDSQFGHSSAENGIGMKANIDSDSLRNINSATKTYFNQMKLYSPEAYDAFSMGEYSVDADADVNVNVIGAAIGITDRITAYAYIPYYQANVNIKYNRLKGNSYSQTAALLGKSESDFAQGLGNVTAQLPDASSGYLQSVLTNTFGYQPIGNWSGQGYGDLELGLVYRFTDFVDKGLAVYGGIVAPTGRTDDINILQDFGFGDGQWDVFLEVGGGMYFTDFLHVDSFVRYTYQAPFTSELRIPYDQNFQLSPDIGEFNIKYGDKIDFHIYPNFSVTDWLGFKPGYEFNYQFQSTYSSNFVEADSILSQNTEKTAHHLKITTQFSTIKLYKQKKFVMPFTVDVTAQKMIKGSNNPKYSRYDVEFRFFF